MSDVEKYEDIINLEHPTSKRHPRMKFADRAAQFSPFAALTGYDDAIVETARVTDRKIELSDDAKTVLNEKLVMIFESDLPESDVTVTYFVADERKLGGKYVSVTGRAVRFDEYKRTVVMACGTEISIEDIIDIDGHMFV